MTTRATLEYMAYLIGGFERPLTKIIALAMLAEGVQ